MYKIIMIDDEDIVLNTLPQAIDWNSYGLELTATFNDAQAALDYIDTHIVDGILTDIQMPVITGLELARRVHKNHPNIVIFIISAYSNFEYAQEAMNYDVAGYVLKPLNFKNLSDTCVKLKEKIDAVYNTNTVYYLNTAQCPDKMQNLISDFINKKRNSLLPDIAQAFKGYDYVCDTESFPCAIISATIIDLPEYLSDTWTHGKENLFIALNQLMICNDLYIFPLSQSFDYFELLILSKTTDMKDFRKTINEFKNNYTTNCFENLNIILSIDILSIYNSLDSVNNTVNANNYGFQKIFNYIKAGNEASATDTFNDMLNICKDNILPDLNNFLITELTNQIGTENLSNIIVYAEQDSYNDTLSLINNSAMYFKNTNTNSKTIYTAKKYIDEHYSENISLAFLSELVYMSISQFTRTFKKEFDISFLNYLNEVRIKQACTLLISTDTPSNTICGMVGYTSYSYFSKKFKQYTGLTVVEYRSKYKSNT